MASYETLDHITVADKIILVRADLNLPMREGHVTDATRVERLIPTVKELSAQGGKVVLMSHFGRPKGAYREEDSLKQLLPTLTKLFGQSLLFAPDCIGPEAEQMAKSLHPGQILLLENLRFHGEEELNDSSFAKALARLGDIYVNDAFSCSHRAHASVVSITHFLPSFAGRGMQAELEALSQVLGNPRHPLLAIVAGSKVSTKLELLQNLVEKVDVLVIGGGMANTFLKALGYPVGQSLCENEMLDTALLILEEAKKSGCEIILPQDVSVTTEIKAQSDRRIVPVSQVQMDDKIVDLGDATLAYIQEKIKGAATGVWNGPVGIFEVPPFDVGSTVLAKCIADQTQKGELVSVAGGGDTLAALAHAGCEKAFTYTSTAGGAFLEWLEGKDLPGVKALEAKTRAA